MSNIAKVALGDICEVNIGRTPARENREYWGVGFPWLSIADMNQGRVLSKTKEQITQRAVVETRMQPAPTGTVLLSFKLSIGKVGIAATPLFTNEAIAALPIKDPTKLIPEFLFWALQSIDLTAGQDRAAMGLTLNKAKLLTLQIPLPPLEEQRRIAAILDQAETLRTQRRTALALLDSLTQSLFLDMFGDALASDERTPMGELVSEFRYGTSEKSGNAGFPTLRIPNVASGSLDLSELKTVSVEAAEFERLRLLCGDLLFVRTNGNPDYVGRCAVFEPTDVENSGFDSSEFIYASYLIRARLKGSDISPFVLQHYLSEGEGRRALRARCKTSAGQYNINTEGLGAIPIPRLPLPLQQTFATRIASIEALKATHRRALAALDALFASLQQRAFTGAL